MSDVPDQDDDVDWKAVVSLLRQGKTAEIPCADERDYARRERQLAKRAEKRGIVVEVLRGEGVLRVQPRPAAGNRRAGNPSFRESGRRVLSATGSSLSSINPGAFRLQLWFCRFSTA